MSTTSVLDTKPASFLMRHERIVIAFMVLAAGTWGYSKWTDIVANRDKDKASTLAAQVQTDAINSAKAAITASQANAAYQAALDSMTAQNASLSKAIAQNLASLKASQATDATSTLAVLDTRWKALAPVTGATTASTNGGIVVSEADARVTIETLEQVSVLQKELDSQTKMLDNESLALNAATDAIKASDAQVDALELQLKDSESANKAEVAAVKAECTKSKRHWFIGGLIVGFAGGIAAHF